MQQSFVIESFNRLGNTIDNLKQAIDHPGLGTNEFVFDALMLRFRFLVDHFHRTLKKILYADSKKKLLPQQLIQASFHSSLISDEQLWLDMWRARNAAVRAYDQQKSQNLVEAIKSSYFPAIDVAYKNLKYKVDHYA